MEYCDESDNTNIKAFLSCWIGSGKLITNTRIINISFHQQLKMIYYD